MCLRLSFENCFAVSNTSVSLAFRKNSFSFLRERLGLRCPFSPCVSHLMDASDGSYKVATYKPVKSLGVPVPTELSPFFTLTPNAGRETPSSSVTHSHPAQSKKQQLGDFTPCSLHLDQQDYSWVNAKGQQKNAKRWHQKPWLWIGVERESGPDKYILVMSFI